MAIRVRRVDSVLVALCAARSVSKAGDIYIDDELHHALAVKFDLDFAREYDYDPAHGSAPEVALMEQEESNNANREEWERTFGKARADAEAEAIARQSAVDLEWLRPYA